jgi:superfamily II DNA/RNA helicase
MRINLRNSKAPKIKEKLKTRNNVMNKNDDDSLKLRLHPQIWQKMNWKQVDSFEFANEVDDSMFLGLEEISGEELAQITKKLKLSETVENNSKSLSQDISHHNTAVVDTNTSVDSLKQKLSNIKVNKKSVKVTETKKKKKLETLIEYKSLSSQQRIWGNKEILLNEVLAESLLKLGYETPIPIQEKAIPIIFQSMNDVVGIAETGSGKTFAYSLPILNTLLLDWNIYCKSSLPMALIIAPTRELVMQISTVIATITKEFNDFNCRINVVSIIGGMSEQKQKRLLNNTHKKPVHIIVATPGRLNEIIQSDDIEIFNDMSRYRYLVIDEVDRIMEEGHFPELNALFHRIRKHETICDNGEDVYEVLERERLGTFEDENDAHVIDELPIDDLFNH